MTIIARAFLQPARSISLRTWPGGRADFRSGVAYLNDERDVICLCQRPDIVIEPVARYLDFLPSWLQKLGEHKELKARIELPEGYQLGPAPEYVLSPPALDSSRSPGGTVVYVDGVRQEASPTAEATAPPKKKGGRQPKKKGGRQPKIKEEAPPAAEAAAEIGWDIPLREPAPEPAEA